MRSHGLPVSPGGPGSPSSIALAVRRIIGAGIAKQLLHFLQQFSEFFRRLAQQSGLGNKGGGNGDSGNGNSGNGGPSRENP